MRQLCRLAQVVFVTDNANVSNIYNKGKTSAMNSANCDLYCELFDLLKTMDIDLQVRWMPSHLGTGKSDPRPDFVSHYDVLANDQADEHAKAAAQTAQLPKPVATNYIYYVSLVVRIQKRLATILLNLPPRQREKEEKSMPVPRMKLDDLLANTSHNVVNLVNRIRCTKCLNSFSLTDPACKAWLQLSCSPAGVSICSLNPTHAPKPLTEPIHIGNQVSQMSHKMASYRGFIYCTQCGSRAGENQIRNLAKQCAPPTNTGEYTLKCISDGRLPPGLTAWPD